jgi:hypothetical protein
VSTCIVDVLSCPRLTSEVINVMSWEKIVSKSVDFQQNLLRTISASGEDYVCRRLCIELTYFEFRTNTIRLHELGDEPKQIRDLHHLPQRTRLEVLTLTLVSVSVSDSVLVLVWILIEGSVMEGEPLGQSLTTTEKRAVLPSLDQMQYCDKCRVVEC